MKVSARSRALRLRLSTKNCWLAGPRASIFPTLMKTHAPQPSIQPVPPATRKESILAIGNSCCTLWPRLGHWPAPLSTSASIVATAMGIKQVYPGRYLPDMLLTLIQREQVTFSHCVPTLLHMMLSSPASQNRDLSGWKVVIGGSALPKGLAEPAIDKGVDNFGGYGMS